MLNKENRAPYNLKDAAEYIGVSRPMMLLLIREKEISARKIGKRRWLISKTILDKWLEQREVD